MINLRKFAERLSRQADDGHGWDKVPQMLRDASSTISALTSHITTHDESCQDMCGRGDQEAVKCGWRPYFESNGRRCPTCPVHDKLGFPSWINP